MATARKPPVSRYCPRCGADAPLQVSRSSFLRYSSDCRCSRCRMVYALPSPKWVAWVSLSSGGLLLAACVAVAVWKAVQLLAGGQAEHVTSSLYYGLSCIGMTAVVGVFVCIHGWRVLGQHRGGRPVTERRPDDAEGEAVEGEG